MSLIVSTYYSEPPREADAIVAGGLTEVANRMVTVTLSSVDWVTGTNSVTDMKLYGDLDPNYMPERYGITHVGELAPWIPFESTATIVLTAGNEQKLVYAQLRNASGVVTPEMFRFVVLNAEPHPTVLWTDGQQTPDTNFQFGWSCSHDWDTMVVTIAPADDATFDESTPLYEFIGPGTAGTMYVVNVDMPTLAVTDPASPQSGIKRMRIWITNGGKWYSLPIVPELFHVWIWDESVWDGDDRWE